MSTEIATRTAAPLPEAVEQALLHGDLAQLSVQDRLVFYHARCRASGLNPMAKPFAYVKMAGGKTVLYALKECAEQLNAIHRISHSLSGIAVDEKKGIIEVTCQARTGDGRETFELGVVSIEGLKGESLANAKMKAVTKAKRRATLSLCGLGDVLDETELDTVQTMPCNDNGTPVPANNGTGVGSGKYAAAVNTDAYRASVEGYLAKRNTEWLDRNTSAETGEMREGIADLCSIWRADGHLAKWCEENGLLAAGSIPQDGKIKNNQIGRLTAIPWFRSDKEQIAMKRELKRYIDDLERQQLEKIELSAVPSEPVEAAADLADGEWQEGRE